MKRAVERMRIDEVRIAKASSWPSASWASIAPTAAVVLGSSIRAFRSDKPRR